MRRLWLIAIALFCATAAQQIGGGLGPRHQTLANPQLPPGVYRVGSGISPPAVIQKKEVEYSQEARVAGLEGTVVLSIVVNEDGTVRDIRIKRPLGLGMDEEAIEAVRGWRFQPGTKDGKPVPVITTI